MFYHHPANRIPVRPSQVIQLTGGLQTAHFLFDGLDSTAWFPGWADRDYPAKAIIDLGSLFQLERIRIFDGSGQPTLRIIAALDDSFSHPTASVPIILDKFSQWRETAFSAQARFILVELQAPEGNNPIGEMEIFGKRLEQSPPASSATTPASEPIAAKKGLAGRIGINGFHWVPTHLIQPFSLYREYIMSNWIWTEKGLMLEPSFQGNGNFDEHFQKLHDSGVTVIPCINRLPDWFIKGRENSPHWQDLRMHRPGLADTTAESYREIGELAFQLAARYGSVRHPDPILQVNMQPRWTNDPTNQKKSGLALLRYLEIENEPNRWWLPAECQYSPEAYATLLSVCYDGHEGLLGPRCGIKTASPDIQVVMAGLANLNLGYLERMRIWFKTHRSDGRFAADILNLHHYCNSGNSTRLLEAPFLQAIAPEIDSLHEKISNVILWRDTRLPGVPVWLTETGYDTQSPSPQQARPFGGLNAEAVQARWLLRSVMEALAGGIDAVFIYNAIDENSAHSGALYASSGLAYGEKPLDPAKAFLPKPAWYALSKLVKELEGYYFSRNLSPSPDSRLYEVASQDSVLWIGWLTSQGNASKVFTVESTTVRLEEEPVVVARRKKRK